MPSRNLTIGPCVYGPYFSIHAIDISGCNSLSLSSAVRWRRSIQVHRFTAPSFSTARGEGAHGRSTLQGLAAPNQPTHRGGGAALGCVLHSSAVAAPMTLTGTVAYHERVAFRNAFHRVWCRRFIRGVQIAEQGGGDFGHRPVHLGAALWSTFRLPEVVCTLAHLMLAIAHRPLSQIDFEVPASCPIRSAQRKPLSDQRGCDS